MTNKKIKVKLRKIIIENRKSRKGRNDMEKTMEKIVALAKSRGYIRAQKFTVDLQTLGIMVT